MAFAPYSPAATWNEHYPLGTNAHQCRVLERPAGIDPAWPRARHAEAPRLVTIYSATRQALAMMVRVGLAPVAVGKGEPSTT